MTKTPAMYCDRVCRGLFERKHRGRLADGTITTTARLIPRMLTGGVH